MPKKIDAWQCEYCNRFRKSKISIARHEEICFSNPDRKILDGQLAVFSTMPRELIITDSYDVPGSEWEEPNWNPGEELLKKYKWWPLDESGDLGLGYVYRCGSWEKIPGYIPPKFSPGFCWKEEYIPM